MQKRCLRASNYSVNGRLLSKSVAFSLQDAIQTDRSVCVRLLLTHPPRNMGASKIEAASSVRAEALFEFRLRAPSRRFRVKKRRLCSGRSYEKRSAAKARKKLSAVENTKRREPIPQHVQDAVWRRDGGKCVKCGSQENLEFDHIIPLSKGGSNTVRNIQLLCQKCNREKSNKIG